LQGWSSGGEFLQLLLVCKVLSPSILNEKNISDLPVKGFKKQLYDPKAA